MFHLDSRSGTQARHQRRRKEPDMAEPKGHKNEADVEAETHEARSRAREGEDDGTYVGQTGPDDALDAGETGAEARSERK
jgi:hypothetical protein